MIKASARHAASQAHTAARIPAAPPLHTRRGSPAATPAGKCACGGGCPTCAPSAATANTRGEDLEAEARRFARGVADGPATAGRREGPLLRPVRRSPPEGIAAHARAGISEPGQPLPRQLREMAGPALGADLGDVRLHTGGTAAAAARALRAKAYTSGADVVFAEGAFRPETRAGRELIAHELAHTVQQARAPRASIQRDEDPNAPAPPAGFSLPGGFTLFPGPERLYQLQGVPIPLPASLRLTNALGTGPGPSFVLDLAPDSLVLSMLGRVDLSASPTAGTAPGHENDPDQQSRVSLVRPVLRLDPATGRITGTATLQVPSGYPTPMRAPTELDVRIESTALGQFTGQIALGPLHADMSLQLHYDVSRLDRAIAPVFAPRGGLEAFGNRINGILLELAPGIRLGGLQDSLMSIVRAVSSGSLPVGQFAVRVLALVAESIPAGADLDSARRALGELGQELAHPGFLLRGSLGLNLPFGGNLPLSTFSAEAPTTRPLEHPLLGAPARFPLTTSIGGVIIAPPGAISEISVPAFGYSYSSYGATSGTSLTAATLPTLSPTAISAPDTTFGEKFPVYAFAELTHVRRLTDSIDAGVRLTLQFSTADFAAQRGADPADPNARLQQVIGSVNESRGPGATANPPVPNIGLTVFGSW